MPTYEARSIIVPGKLKQLRTQDINVLLDAVAQEKTIQKATLAELEYIPVRTSSPNFPRFFLFAQLCRLLFFSD